MHWPMQPSFRIAPGPTTRIMPSVATDRWRSAFGRCSGSQRQQAPSGPQRTAGSQQPLQRLLTGPLVITLCFQCVHPSAVLNNISGVITFTAICPQRLGPDTYSTQTEGNSTPNSTPSRRIPKDRRREFDTNSTHTDGLPTYWTLTQDLITFNRHP